MFYQEQIIWRNISEQVFCGPGLIGLDNLSLYQMDTSKAQVVG